MRGNRGDCLLRRSRLGPTPARAGQPGTVFMGPYVFQAYPRACGATRIIDARLASPGGLPPRVRGNRVLARRPFGQRGPTPARAGQPMAVIGAGAYPRACGATDGPRPTWPTPARAGQPPTGHQGLPPRVRGNLLRIPRDPRACGATADTSHARPTPARAGQPPNHCVLPPRVRGNRDRTVRGCTAYPRACGATLVRPYLGPTPARAGQPTSSSTRAYPRACGAT